MTHLIREFLKLISVSGSILAGLSIANGSEKANYDVVIVGATPAGISAAVTAEREGLDAVIVSPYSRIGGLVTNGLSNTDIRTLQSQGGIWKDFADRVVQHYALQYGQNSKQVEDCFHGLLYEPKVALSVFYDMLRETDTRVLTRHRLVKANVNTTGIRSRLESIEIMDLDTGERLTVNGKAFVDATYEGDLLAMAGAEFHLGTDSDRGQFPQAPWKFPEEIFGGLQYDDDDQYHVMGINFRVLVTKNPKSRIPFPKPEGYDPSIHQDIVDAIESGKELRLKDVIQILRIPNNKANLNDRKTSIYSGFSLYNESDDWPEGTPVERKKIWEKAKWKAENFFYFLANDPRLPKQIRDEMSEWGYSRDEFEDNRYFPEQVYIREGRRLQGVETSTARDFEPDAYGVRSPNREDAVTISDYGMSSHGTHFGPDGREYGNFQFATRPLQLPYGIMIPKNLDGLIVPVGVSSTQVAFGAIRMEPTWMTLAQAAAYAAKQAIDEDIELRNVDVTRLQRKLHQAGALTFYTADVYPDSPYFRAVQFFGNHGLFQDLNPASVVPTEGNAWGDHILGQYFEPFYGHEIEPHRLMTHELAIDWISRINQFFGKSIKLHQFGSDVEKYYRGRFLNKLYNIAIEDREPKFSSKSASASMPRPNILLILADDFGIDAVDTYGGSTYVTPSLNRLVQEGTRFTHAFATPLCTPSRVQLLSGQYPVRTGWPSLIHKRPRDDRYVSPEIPTIAQVLRNVGYSTCISGKWQLGYLGQDPEHPVKMGFDSYALWEWRDYEIFELTSCYGNPVIRQNGIIRDDTEGQFGPDLHADFIVDFIKQDREEPWFVFYPMIYTHFPFIPTPELWGDNGPPPEAIGFPPKQGEPNYFPWMVKDMDEIIGRLLATLDSSGQRDNTLILFVGDNGTDPIITSSYRSQSVSGGKGELNGAGCRVPLIVSCPGYFPKGHTSDKMVDLTDIFPTLTSAAGVEYNGHIDGEDMHQLIFQSSPPEIEFAFTQLDDHWRIFNHRIAVDDKDNIYDVTSPFNEQILNTHPEAGKLKRLAKAIAGE